MQRDRLEQGEIPAVPQYDLCLPTGKNVQGNPKPSVHKGKGLGLYAPGLRPPTWWFTNGSPLGLLEGELQGGVQRFEAIL